MIVDKKMAMVEKALVDVVDCLNGLISEQDYTGLRSYTNDPERMMAELEGARELVREYAYGDAPCGVCGSEKYNQKSSNTPLL